MPEYTVTVMGQFKDMHTVEASSEEEAEKRAVLLSISAMTDVDIADVFVDEDV